jgi:two-component system CheB/CheR fusion protein
LALADIEAPDAAPAVTFPIVAIGASAGGLGPLCKLLDNIPPDSGMGFVVVSHLDPTRESRLPELLSRHTAMPVGNARDQQSVQTDHVYVIPPNASLIIEGGIFQLGPAPARSAPSKPIDLFMGSLARDQKAFSVAIVLSGIDADGTIGLKHVKAHGGLAMVQEPHTAEYREMPQNALATGLVDFVLPVEQMGSALVDYAQNAGLREHPHRQPSRSDADDTTGILLALAKDGAADFREYKPSMIERRIRHRMAMMAISSLAEFRKLVETSPEVRQSLTQDFLIGVTEFFREPKAWKTLSESILPGLFDRARERPLRAWVPGCASGEEAYSLAMLLSEHAPSPEARARIEIFATDIDRLGLEQARAGIYPSSAISSLTPERLQRFFTPSGNAFQVQKELRSLVVFSPQNLLVDPPFSRMNIISCRNLLIYLQTAAQRHLASVFAFSLEDHGVLFLGRAESLPDTHEFFEETIPHSGIFRRKPGGRPRRLNFNMSPQPLSQDASRGRTMNMRTQEMAQLVQKALLTRFTPAAVLVDRTFQVLYFHGDAEPFLRRAPGVPSDSLLEMLREGLLLGTRSALNQAIDQAHAAMSEAEMLHAQQRVRVRIQVVPMRQPHGADPLYLTTFEVLAHAATTAESTEAGDASSDVGRELQQARQDMQEMIDNLQQANEELKVAHEESLSANEELQSANEELASSKEETQSLNEELTTVNAQLEMKVGELQQSNDDLHNLLRNTRIACLFLDRELRIRRYTPAIAQLISIIPSDIGRPIRDFASPFAKDDLIEVTQQVLTDLKTAEAEMNATDGRWYWRSVQPYESATNYLDGVVVTFTDITSLKQVEQGMRRLATVMRDSNDAVTVHDFGGRIFEWNRAAERMYGYSASEARALGILSIVPEARRDEYELMIARAHRGEPVASFETQRRTKDGRTLDVWLTVSVLHDEHGVAYAVATTERDISDRLRGEQQLRYRTMQLQEADRRRTEFLAMLAHELRNPLAPVQNALHLLSHPKTSPEQVTWATDVMERQTLHLQRLIDDLLDVSRIISGKVRLRRETIDLRSVIRDATEATTPLAGAGSQTVEVTVPEEPLWVFGDNARLQQVIGNLLSNARKYSDEKSNITLEASLGGDQVVVRVADQGIGIPPDLMPQIFELFIQGDQAMDRAQGGLGIGLTLVKQLVEMHNGSVEAHSAGVGTGSEFIVRLPALAEKPASSPAPLQPRRTRSSKRRRVLIVDDNIDFAAGMKILLEHEGHTAEIAHDGKSAVETAKRFSPEVVLLDLGLPRMNGFETAQALRALLETRDALLIAVSGYGQEDDLRRSERAGFDRHLKKPIDPKQLLAALQAR